jgi:hypothetical protein
LFVALWALEVSLFQGDNLDVTCQNLFCSEEFLRGFTLKETSDFTVDLRMFGQITFMGERLSASETLVGSFQKVDWHVYVES